MNHGVVISCFDKSTNTAKPWADAGYLCFCVDLQHPPGETQEGNIIKVGANMFDWLPPRKKIIFAAFAPPCTHVAASGARWFKDKGLGCLIEALKCFDISVKLAEWCGCPYMIENPVSTIATYWRASDYSFDPCDYGGYLNPPGDRYTKKTHLWTGGGFKMPKIKPVAATEGSRMHTMSKSDDRAELRSVSPAGFSIAVFEANKQREV